MSYNPGNDEMFVRKDENTGEPITGFPFRVEWDNGDVIYGTSNQRWRTNNGKNKGVAKRRASEMEVFKGGEYDATH